MPHKLFLFDLDDTLLDYQKSEQLSFAQAVEEVGFLANFSELFARFQAINFELWLSFEAGAISRDHLKVERWRRTFLAHALELDHERASHLYLESFVESAVLVDGAKQVCEALSGLGEVGVITNGVDEVQRRRLAASGLMSHISFVSTSEAAGFAKPDVRFFEHTARMAKPFQKREAIIIGDRLEADIVGAEAFGIASCWFNPGRKVNTLSVTPTYEVIACATCQTYLRGRRRHSGDGPSRTKYGPLPAFGVDHPQLARCPAASLLSSRRTSCSRRWSSHDAILAAQKCPGNPGRFIRPIGPSMRAPRSLPVCSDGRCCMDHPSQSDAQARLPLGALRRRLRKFNGLLAV